MAIDKEQRLSGDAAYEKVRGLLADFPIAFMITTTDGGSDARPIGVVGDHGAFDGTLWFITDRRSNKVSQIAHGAGTLLVFQNDERGTYLHLSGQATVVEDPQRLRELYTPVQRTWFPDGPDDPNITLIRFDAREAHYWEGHQSTVRLVLAFVKAVVTGSPGSSGDAGTAQL
jgi:general stress protein 26